MRPVNRGLPPSVAFEKYEDAKPRLVEVLGLYCSYCERKVVSMLAVEHIQPKGLAQYAHLMKDWRNFLLACVNCNSAKSDKPVDPDTLYLPDRDNTFRAFMYDRDGLVKPSPDLSLRQKAIANATIELLALNRQDHENWTDTRITHAALERWSQRRSAIISAELSLTDFEQMPVEEIQRCIVRTAIESGFFSIWMQVFSRHVSMRSLFIKAFPGTADDCFDANCRCVKRPGGKL